MLTSQAGTQVLPSSGQLSVTWLCVWAEAAAPASPSPGAALPDSPGCLRLFPFSLPPPFTEHRMLGCRARQSLPDRLLWLSALHPPPGDARQPVPAAHLPPPPPRLRIPAHLGLW